MNEKKSAFYTIFILTAIMLAFTFADLIQGDRTFSETENRVLARKPKFSWEALLTGDYTGDYEAYLTDQFVSRDKWIRINTYLDIALQKQEINGVYLGSDHTLIEQHLPEAYPPEQEEKRLELLERLVERWDAKVMLVPTADNVLWEKMPVWAPYYDEAVFLEQAEARVGAGHYVDVYSVLRGHAGEKIFYRTDHHWTVLGAFYGYQAWKKAAGAEGDFYDKNHMVTVSDSFLGTLQSKVNLDVPPDSIEYFPMEENHKVKVTYDRKETRESFYEESYLETKNQYGFFLDDNHAFLEIDTDCRNDKTLFVIKDSFANCFIPLLAPHYSKIYVMDLRYFNGRLFGFMENYEPEEGMDVLVLYNCIHFLEDFNYLE